ncbi:SPOR domain-containing protein [Falsiroseomonas stagni]|uniref:Sporulation related domain-containing protein n=1 Tax=Falsiroseomonas stagni DSM 19981 TaxID=1123062 RepID=A0A1I4ASA8_9PROT|nr:SPOR domain-containing protein [Falsiroseomonas stagni]SFK58536.1 Sporulation related domain-containing protein [Falsiroseomonas stagni DSM 19981]
MSDAMVPSYRLHRPASAVPWRMIAMAGGVLAFVAAGAAGWWAIERIGARSVPVVEADPRPFKVRPSDPGGLRVPNQSELVLERPGQRAQGNAATTRAPGLAPEAEAPNIGGLRAAVAPPPVVAPAPTWPPQPAPRPGQAVPGQNAPGASAPAAAPPANGNAPAAAAPAAPQAAARQAPAAAPPPATPAPAATAITPPARPAGSGRVQVQIAALTSEDSARAEWDRVARRAPELFQGRSPAVTRLDRDGQAPLFRLRTGGFADQDAAREFCEQVRARGATCIPVR